MRVTTEVYSQIALFNVEEAVTHADLQALGSELKKVVGTPVTHVFVNFLHANVEGTAVPVLERMKESLVKVTHKIVHFSFEAASHEKWLQDSHVPEARQGLDKFRLEEKIRAVDAEITAIRGPDGGNLSDGQRAHVARVAATEERLHQFYQAQLKSWKMAIAQKASKLSASPGVPPALEAAEKRLLAEFAKANTSPAPAADAAPASGKKSK